MDTVTDWQRKIATQIADHFEHGGQRLDINWARRYGRLTFRDRLDREMAARGWTVLAPRCVPRARRQPVVGATDTEEAMPEAQRELATYDDPDVQFCVVGGVNHDYRPHTARSQFGPYERTYWRCVWCHGVTCGDYDEDDPCWLPYHHRTPHRTRSGVTWPVGGNPPGTC